MLRVIITQSSGLKVNGMVLFVIPCSLVHTTLLHSSKCMVSQHTHMVLFTGVFRGRLHLFMHLFIDLSFIQKSISQAHTVSE